MGRIGQSKYKFADAKQILEDKGYKVLSTGLNSISEKIDYICLKHKDKGVQHIDIYHIMSGRGCYYCGREKTEEGRKAKIDEEYDKRLCEQHGFEYVNTIIENHIVWIEIICPKHRYVGIQRIKKGNLKRETTHACVYCIGRKVHPLDSFGNKHIESVELWSDKNTRTPYDYSPSSNSKVWFKCENSLHKDYFRSINDIHRRGFRCPECAKLKKESYLQQKVRLYFNELGYSLLHEFDCSLIDINPLTNYKMPYDNQEDDKLKLIIEVHGKQHYEVDKLTIMQALHQDKSLEEILKYQQWKDNHKKEYALSQGYNYLIIPYWTIKNDEYKIIINNKIDEILKNKLSSNN